jgi:MarR family transcriptional regulator, transcriptional regulator for hemolysin
VSSVPPPINSPVIPPFNPLGRSIGRAHKLVRAWGDGALADLGSSVIEWIVLINIDNAAPPGASQAEIARYSDIGGPALVRHIDRLEADGLVTRTRDTADRRTTRLNLTVVGRDHCRAIGAVMARCDKELRAVLTEREAAVMQSALDKIFEFCVGQLVAETTTTRGQTSVSLPGRSEPRASTTRSKR